MSLDHQWCIENCEDCPHSLPVEVEKESPYCDTCQGCGEVGCDGIERFIDKHVRGQTNCKYEESYIKDILQTYKDIAEIYEKKEKVLDEKVR